MSTPISLDAWAQEAQRVLDFWFLPSDDPAFGNSRGIWFVKNVQFDQLIADQFGVLIQAGLAQQIPPWDNSQAPQLALAQIILLDQFTRNTGRDTPAAFAGDPLALQTSLALIDSGLDSQLLAMQRWFVYMPLEHAEDLALQQRCCALFAQLAQEQPAMAGALHYAELHRAVIARFGRFPHRNAILGRSSSAAELAFLQEPGSRF